MLVNKVIKPGGGEPDEFERSIGQALLELEVNSEMKPQLRDLHITRAKEIECDNKKVRGTVPIPDKAPTNQRHSPSVFIPGYCHLRADAQAEGIPEDPDPRRP